MEFGPRRSQRVKKTPIYFDNSLSVGPSRSRKRTRSAAELEATTTHQAPSTSRSRITPKTRRVSSKGPRRQTTRRRRSVPRRRPASQARSTSRSRKPANPTRKRAASSNATDQPAAKRVNRRKSRVPSSHVEQPSAEQNVLTTFGAVKTKRPRRSPKFPSMYIAAQSSGASENLFSGQDHNSVSLYGFNNQAPSSSVPGSLQDVPQIEDNNSFEELEVSNENEELVGQTNDNAQQSRAESLNDDESVDQMNQVKHELEDDDEDDNESQTEDSNNVESGEPTAETNSNETTETISNEGDEVNEPEGGDETQDGNEHQDEASEEPNENGPQISLTETYNLVYFN